METQNIQRLSFASDYMEGAHPAILRRLAETNLEKTGGYGADPYTLSAKEKIRAALGCPDADVFFLVGGTQTNATVISALLRSYQGVLSASTGHISVHEAGAIEHNGHKVLPLPHENGKITAQAIARYVETYNADESCEHMVMPGMVYISQPTEYGTLYSLRELEEISETCRALNLPLYVDGARLAYALACPENDVRLQDLARLCDAFYIGGTKCGALFGEAVVFPKPGFVPHFFTIIKQQGALLAKGRIAGIQFDTLFTDGLYEEIGRTAIREAGRIRTALIEKGYELVFGSPTNQLFAALTPEQRQRIERSAGLCFWETRDDGRTVMRICTSWATSKEDVDALIAVL